MGRPRKTGPRRVAAKLDQRDIEAIFKSGYTFKEFRERTHQQDRTDAEMRFLRQAWLAYPHKQQLMKATPGHRPWAWWAFNQQIARNYAVPETWQLSRADMLRPDELDGMPTGWNAYHGGLRRPIAFWIREAADVADWSQPSANVLHRADLLDATERQRLADHATDRFAVAQLGLAGHRWTCGYLEPEFLPAHAHELGLYAAAAYIAAEH